MDNDIGNPTGYIKVEINCEAAKLQLSLSNLLSTPGICYKLYGIKKNEKQLIYTDICDVPESNGRAEIKINTESSKLGSNKVKLEDVNIFAVIAQIPHKTSSIRCPLVAYTKGELEWKSEFEKAIKAVSTENTNTALKTDEAVKHEEKKEIEQKEILTGDIYPNEDNIGETEGFELKIKAERTETKKEQAKEAEITGNKPVNAVKPVGNDTINSKNIKEYEQINEIKIKENNQFNEININNKQSDNNAVKKMIHEEVEHIPPQENPNIIFDEEEETPIQDFLGFNGKSDLASKLKEVLSNFPNIEGSTALEHQNVSDEIQIEDDILGSAEKNFNDISAIGDNSDKIKKGLNKLSLKEELDETFESYNPFKMRSKRFKWWKINSPGLLNNILFRNNVKTYLLFNPKVMLAHYKYKYIIFGIRNDIYLGKEYFVCGVPGVYSIDENPFGNLGSWAQTEGYKTKYGSFGYWLVLIDPRTGKLIKMK
jgi:hypothetical protein